MPDQLPAIPTHLDSVLNMIARAASDPSVDIGKLESLMAMQERVMARENAQRFNAAMSEAQAEMEPVIKDAANPFLKSKYAKLEAIDKAIRPIYTRHGFGVRYRCEESDKAGIVKVVCTVSHAAGHIEEFPISAPLDAAGSKGNDNKPAVQAVGSTITYLKRYALTMAFNVVTSDDSDDDDGEATRAPKQPRGPAQPDPKAVKWKDDVIAEFGQIQTEKVVTAYWTKIRAQYDAVRVAWPGMADEIDAAGQAALDRIRELGLEQPAAPAEGDAV